MRGETSMFEEVLFKNRQPERPATLDEYRRSGGYQALMDALKNRTPEEVRQLVLDSGLRGRGGAGFPTGRKWAGIPAQAGFPRYLVPNTDEMEPGTFKDRILVNIDPHLVLEGIILAGYAVRAEAAYFFIRPSYERDAQLIEREAEVARQAGFLGKNILGSDFSFDLVVHRSAGRYICGEATAQVNAIMGHRAHPMKDRRMAQDGLWHRPTIVNNAETLACVPHYPAAWGGLVQRPGPQQGRRRHQALLRQRQGQPARLLRAAHRHPPAGNPGGAGRGDAPGLGVEGVHARRRLHRLNARQILRRGNGFRTPGKGGTPFGNRSHYSLRPEDLPGGRHPEPDRIFRPGILRLVHPLPGGTSLYSGLAVAPGGRGGPGGIYPHAAADGRAHG